MTWRDTPRRVRGSKLVVVVPSEKSNADFPPIGPRHYSGLPHKLGTRRSVSLRANLYHRKSCLTRKYDARKIKKLDCLVLILPSLNDIPPITQRYSSHHSTIFLPSLLRQPKSSIRSTVNATSFIDFPFALLFMGRLQDV